MDIDYAGEKGMSAISLKSDFMISLCETVMNGNSRYSAGLTPSQISIIDRCITIVFKDYINSKYKDRNGKEHYDETKIPTLLDFQKVLKSQKERDAIDLALALEVYTQGNLDIFSYKTNVNTKNRFLVYNIRDLGSGMQSLAMLIILDSIWNRILANKEKGKRTWVCIDESHLLVKNDTSADFLNTLYKRSRKYNALFTCITQNVGDFLASEITKNMISNSEFVQLLNQAPLDREQLAALLNISDTQCNYLKAATKGSGLLVVSQNIIVPFKDDFPQDTQLYRVMTTKPQDIAKYQKEEEERQMREKHGIPKRDKNGEKIPEKKQERELTRYEKSIRAQIEAQKEAQKKMQKQPQKSERPQQPLNTQKTQQPKPQQQRQVKPPKNVNFVEDIDDLDDLYF